MGIFRISEKSVLEVFRWFSYGFGRINDVTESLLVQGRIGYFKGFQVASGRILGVFL